MAQSAYASTFAMMVFQAQVENVAAWNPVAQDAFWRATGNCAVYSILMRCEHCKTALQRCRFSLSLSWFDCAIK
jgi:hypothetical protein